MIKNNTNIIVQTTKITNILIELITNDIKPCHVISMEKLYHAYRDLEISSEEILNSYEFSIEIAHHVKADYILYGVIYNDDNNVNQLNIELQLILLKTGEILHVIRKSIDT